MGRHEMLQRIAVAWFMLTRSPYVRNRRLSQSRRVQAGKETAMDIFSLIKTDHQEVAGLFKKLHDAQGSRATCEQLFAQLKEAIELHAHAEEQVFYPALQEDDVTEEIVEEALEDHQLVAELLEELATTPKDHEAWNEKLQILEENVQEHVDEE